MTGNPAPHPSSAPGPAPGPAPGADPGGADFGFRRVRASEKPRLVRAVFDSVAPRYDLMNDLMSAGVHRIWKRIYLAALNPRPSMRLLDLASGTGDIAFGFLERGGGSVLATDINAEMLGVARDRCLDFGLVPGPALAFAVADAERLPLADAGFDAVTMAFGLRNCTHIERVLAEAFRVLRPGGRFLCLEFSRVQVAALRPLYDAYSFAVLPRLGRWVAGDEEAYRYLAESIRKFPPQEELAAMMGRAGFERVSYRNLSAGIAAIHSGWRL